MKYFYVEFGEHRIGVFCSYNEDDDFKKVTWMLFLLKSSVVRVVRGEKSSEDFATDFKPFEPRCRC